MHVGVTLTPEEFSKLHNALCHLSSAATEVADIGHREEAEEIAKEVESIRELLKPAYEADNAMFSKLHKHFREVGEEFGAETAWSMYEVHDLNTEHHFAGAKTVTHDTHWGETTPVIDIKGNTWRDLFIAADAAIKQSGDMHHSFIENFSVDGDTLKLHTGS